MKKYILTILCFSAGLMACKKDFISLTPEDQTSGATFFKTQEQFTQAITAAYQPLRRVFAIDYLMAEMRSDNTFYDFYPSDRGNGLVYRENIDNFRDDQSNSIIYDMWAGAYDGISKSNIVLGRIEGLNFPDDFKNNIIGQAKFLRAFYYFRLVRYYGGVPLYLKEVTTTENAFLPRAAKEAVYETIIADVKDAILKLAAPATFPQPGNATKGAAEALLAEVYMTQQKYADAEPLLKDITKMGYALLPDYASVFNPANKNSRESIFEVQYQQGNQGQQSNFIYLFLPHSAHTTPLTGLDYNNINIGGWNMPTNDMINAYEEGDKRLDASIAVAEGSIDATGSWAPESIKSIVNYHAPAGKTGKPFIKKYLHAHTNVNNTDDNWPVYRYADILLLLAECLNEQPGKSSEALAYVNQVRVPRSGLTAVTATDPALLRNIIAHERRIELAFENHRWFDLVRTGQAVPVMTAHGVAMKQQYGFLNSNAYLVNNNRLIYSLPFSEMQVNSQLTPNNPGY
ncbi:RagB/SusD family nutrient uptake outer membrane protein [Chitinophaga sp. 22321]|uniref:RagB/SusD family nutrient uptake outer membrane protein n=1 Tax=Chitinophaga hostae TaxID=2831022 RepID=A0ABS5J962_9BACT|nr:RagB/SusD family nutrient uptake outer membrane protein [Chitinophaga hostae]MBS0031588.1 RagB/SusD family nutrient uptake outer membrane protein [Chitinophaga hostae]